MLASPARLACALLVASPRTGLPAVWRSTENSVMASQGFKLMSASWLSYPLDQ